VRSGGPVMPPIAAPEVAAGLFGATRRRLSNASRCLALRQAPGLPGMKSDPEAVLVVRSAQDAVDATLTPQGAQYVPTQSNPEKRYRINTQELRPCTGSCNTRRITRKEGRSAVRVRSSALLFSCKYAKNGNPRCSCQGLVSSRLFQGLVHTISCVPTHAGYPVRVAVKSHRYAGMSKKMLDQFRMNATPQKQRSARVSEVVPADRGGVCLLEERLEVAVDYVLGVLLCGVPLRVAKTSSESS
jgi:hypothetical protein